MSCGYIKLIGENSPNSFVQFFFKDFHKSELNRKNAILKKIWKKPNLPGSCIKTCNIILILILK